MQETEKQYIRMLDLTKKKKKTDSVQLNNNNINSSTETQPLQLKTTQNKINHTVLIYKIEQGNSNRTT